LLARRNFSTELNADHSAGISPATISPFLQSELGCISRPIREGQTEIEVRKNLRVEHADTQGISEGCVRDNGGNLFCELLLR
jgi:hypothetical protein